MENRGFSGLLVSFFCLSMGGTFSRSWDRGPEISDGELRVPNKEFCCVNLGGSKWWDFFFDIDSSRCRYVRVVCGSNTVQKWLADFLRVCWTMGRLVRWKVKKTADNCVNYKEGKTLTSSSNKLKLYTTFRPDIMYNSSPTSQVRFDHIHQRLSR